MPLPASLLGLSYWVPFILYFLIQSDFVPEPSTEPQVHASNIESRVQSNIEPRLQLQMAIVVRAVFYVCMYRILLDE